MLKYVLYVCINIPFSIICYLLNPFVMLFARNDNLPHCLSWFQTQDSALDSSFIKSLFPYFSTDSWFDKYMRGLLWLYRNTGYTFAYSVLGVEVDVNAKTIKKKQLTTSILMEWDSTKPWYSRSFVIKGDTYYGNTDWYCDVYIGWKYHTAKVEGSNRCMLAMRINPLRKKIVAMLNFQV